MTRVKLQLVKSEPQNIEYRTAARGEPFGREPFDCGLRVERLRVERLGRVECRRVESLGYVFK